MRHLLAGLALTAAYNLGWRHGADAACRHVRLAFWRSIANGVLR